VAEIVNINAARDHRAAAKRQADHLGQVIADRLVSQGISQAERAFRVADPIAPSDPEKVWALMDERDPRRGHA